MNAAMAETETAIQIRDVDIILADDPKPAVALLDGGFTREQIAVLRAAYRLLFADEGTFQERLDDVAEGYAHIPEIVEILEFIRVDATRPLCLPHREM